MEHPKSKDHTVVIDVNGEELRIEMNEEMSIEVNMQGEFAWGPGPVMSVPFSTNN